MDCPFCGRRGHLYCNVDDGEDWDGKKKPAGRWICFGCQEKSLDFARLLMELDGVPFQEARATIVKWKLGGTKLQPGRKQYTKTVKAEGPWLPPEYEPCSKIWVKYLDRRNITKETATKFALGVCRKGMFAHRIILPIDCPAGRSFQARAILDKTQPRYLSGDNSGQLLFGWQTIENKDLAVIVEGPFDAINVYQAGFGSVALMGKELRDSQRGMLKALHREYVVALDPMSKDKLAIDSACDIAQQLDGRVVVTLESDPGASSLDEIRAAVKTALPPMQARQMALAYRLKHDATALMKNRR